MNKSELIETFAIQREISHKRAEEVVNMIFNSMSEAMIAGDRIEIRGLGSFVVKEYGSYTGRIRKPVSLLKSNLRSFLSLKLVKSLRSGFSTVSNRSYDPTYCCY